MDREAWRAVVHGVAKSQTRVTELTDLELGSGIKRKSILGFLLSCNYRALENIVKHSGFCTIKCHALY